MIKARIRWCTCRVENILTLGKLLSLWFCFLHSIVFGALRVFDPRDSAYAVNLTYDRHMHIILEKWFPLQGERGHSSYFRCFQKQNREEGETE